MRAPYLRLIVAIHLAVPILVWGGTWRVGDSTHPWNLRPVSTQLDASSSNFRPEYLWGGAFSVEIVVDDDGDGQIDEDGPELIDNDGDGFVNEDPSDGLDNDLDGLVDEDGPDPQRDNDGDGWINEDGLMTGGRIVDASLRTEPPWSTRDRPGEWGDDDRDGLVNEDPINGRDDDSDGLVDEDGPAPEMPVNGSWNRLVYSYDATLVADAGLREHLSFSFDPERGSYAALIAGGDSLYGHLRSSRFEPKDWLRPIRLDSTRNLATLVEDRFLAGQFVRPPIDTGPYTGTYKSPPLRAGDRHIGMAFDNDLSTARFEPGGGDLLGRFINIEFGGLFLIDRLRLYPRPQFPDRVLTHFRTLVAGDRSGDIFVINRGLVTEASLNPTRFLFPEQVDRKLPVIKDFRLDGGELGEPERARVISIETTLPKVGGSHYATAPWEVAEVELFGRGYAMDASYVTEIIDVSTGRIRRYFDENGRMVTFESILSDRQAQKRSFDPERGGQHFNWGRVRWKGRLDGDAAVTIRVRAGTTPDPNVYQRQLSEGVVSVLDAGGSVLDAVSYLSLSATERVPVQLLPDSRLITDDAGLTDGWTPWSAPLDYHSGLVQATGGGGVALPVSALSRFIQFRLDFANDENAAAALDYIEVDFAEPHVGGAVVAEIYPDQAHLGASADFVYVIKPIFLGEDDQGFNRIDIAVPSSDVRVDSFLVDNLAWGRIRPKAPDHLDAGGDLARSYIDSLEAEQLWLDSLDIDQDRVFATAIYTVGGKVILSIKTRGFHPEDFGLGQTIDLRFNAAVYSIHTEFRSWVWDDSSEDPTKQPVVPGDATGFLPSNGVGVVADDVPVVMELGDVSRVFTPNGDGQNDVGVFPLQLYLVDEQIDVAVEIWDLSGAHVATVGPHVRGAGKIRLTWDGRRDSGQLVTPGIYVYRVVVDSDTRRPRSLGTIAVAY